MLSRGIAGHGAYRRIFFIPVLFSIIAVGFLWGLYLKPKGMVNSLLSLMGRQDLTRAWLGDGSIATYTIIAVNNLAMGRFSHAGVYERHRTTVPAECTRSGLIWMA